MPAAEVIGRCDATGGAGDTRDVVTANGGRPGPRRIVFLGVGSGSPADMRKAGAALGRLAAPGGRVITSAVLGQPAPAAGAFAEGLLLGSY
ncbi:MAG: leucyl aminopeptidase, partial [Actinobacteria bacterium]|nr:leucyl aminopeptidase [Actinomycetota bacterium]